MYTLLSICVFFRFCPDWTDHVEINAGALEIKHFLPLLVELGIYFMSNYSVWKVYISCRVLSEEEGSKVTFFLRGGWSNGCMVSAQVLVFFNQNHATAGRAGEFINLTSLETLEGEWIFRNLSIFLSLFPTEASSPCLYLLNWIVSFGLVGEASDLILLFLVHCITHSTPQNILKRDRKPPSSVCPSFVGEPFASSSFSFYLYILSFAIYAGYLCIYMGL